MYCLLLVKLYFAYTLVPNIKDLAYSSNGKLHPIYYDII